MTDSEHLFQLVGQKLERLEQLHTCSGNQMQYVIADEMGAILEILAAKQRLLLEIEGIDRQIAQYHVDDPEDRVWPSREMREQCRERISRCDLLVRETLEFDRLVEQCLTEKKDAAKQQLQHFTDTAHVQGAYRRHKTRPSTSGSMRLDLGAE
ncbi:MAG: hypothetical protein FWH27_08255 [Planctomycetaceae bacterium]|nr:hypothetical protein [Planctomycetaceae bacterium]